MGRCLLQGLLLLVATLQVLVAQAPSVLGLFHVKDGVLQGGMRQVGPPGNSIIIQAHPGAADRDDLRQETQWRNPSAGGVGGTGGMEQYVEQEAGVSHHSSKLQLLEQDTSSSHSTPTLDTGAVGGGYEVLPSRMVTSGAGGTEQESADGGEAGSRSSHHLHWNVATPKAPRRRSGRSPGALRPLQGADGGSSTPTLPSHTQPLEDGDMAAQSAPIRYKNPRSSTATTNNNVGIITTLSTPPQPSEDTLRPTHDVVVVPRPEVNVHDAPTGTLKGLAADVDTSHLSSSSEDEDEDMDESIILVDPTLAPSTRHYYTFPPRLKPNLAYFGFIVYDTTPGYHGNTDHAHQSIPGRDTAVWIAILSVACFLAGIMITTIVCYAVYRRKWRPSTAPGGSQHLEDDLPPSENIDEPDRGGGGSSATGSTEQLLPVVTGSTKLELLTCSQTNLLQCDFLNDGHHDNQAGGGQMHLHRYPTAQEQQGEGAGDGLDHSSSQRRSSRGGSTSTCSRSSCSTCSTVLTLDLPGLAEEGGVRRPSNGSATGGDSPGVVSWGQPFSSRHDSVSTDNGYFTPGGSSLVDWTSET